MSDANLNFAIGEKTVKEQLFANREQVSANTGLLKTKYTMPGTGRLLLPRQALTPRLDEALNSRLTLITAPAGYGKTTAVMKWLETVPVPHAWLSIDDGDNDVLSFWRYFSAALDSISNGISREVEYVFASAELFKANMHINILIDSLSEAGSNFLLVLDDLHSIKNPAVYEGLSFFLSYMPSNMHLVLVSRTKPGLKLTRLGMKEDLVRIRANDLRFGTEEILQYFRSRGFSLQKDELEIIESYTEGWAAALVAVALSLKSEKSMRSTIRNFGSCSLHINDYLSEDVFNMWSEQQQDFMEKTAVLDRLCAPLCEAITGYDGSSLLKELYDQNTFLTALDDDGIWFQYHRLFSDFLRKRMEGRAAASVSGLHRKAGEWLAANGLYQEAIEHYLKGAHYEDALPLIENQGEILFRKGEYSHAVSWIERLPDKYVKGSPMLTILKAFYFTHTYDFKRATACIEHLEPALKEAPLAYGGIYPAYMMAKANLFLLQGNLEDAFSTMAAAASFGVNSAMNTDYVDFNLYDISMYRSVYNIFINFLRTRRAEYESFLKNYRNLISTYPGYAPLLKGELLYESGKMDEALPALANAADEAMNAGCPGALVPAMATIAKIKRSRGDIRGAMETVEECEKAAASYHKPHWSYMLKAFKARLYIDADKTEALDLWMAESRLGVYSEISRIREFELIVYARALMKKQRYDDADILLNRLLRFAEGLGRNHSIVEIVNLLAITALKDLNEEEAVKYMTRALSIGVEEGYMTSFVDELSPMISLLELFIRKNKNPDRLAVYAKNLFAQTKEAIRNSIYLADFGTIENTLTPTEKKVLYLIYNAYSNKEIADKLCITLRTVTTHTGSIYKKLGVKNRAQCIKKVRGI